MTKILITGADSFVGTNFIRFSKYRDVEEVSLFINKPEDINFSQFDVVLHLVAIVHQLKKIHEKEYYKINRDLCIKVAKRAKESGIKQFVFLSTVKVYGKFNPESGPWNESSECHPEDPYGRSKYEAETELRKLEDKDFAVSIIRTPLVYGKDVRANMLSIMKLVDRFPILPFGIVNNKRSFTYTENLAGFIDRIIEKRASGTFLAMDEKPLSTTELVNYISKFLNKKVVLIKIPGFIIKIGKLFTPRIFDRLYGSFEMDNSKTLKILGFKPPFTSAEGIKKMVQAYKKSKDKSQK